MIDFKVVSITVRADCMDVELQAKAHPIFTSSVYLHLPAGELSKFSIGQSYSLTGAEEAEVIETVPPGGRTDIPMPSPDMWNDGSPIQDDCDGLAAQDREPPGYRPPAPLGIPGDSLASGAAREIERKGGYQL